MRKIFQNWLFLVVSLAFLGLLTLNYYIQTKASYEAADNLIELRIDDVIKQLSITVENHRSLKKASKMLILEKVSTAAYILSKEPAAVTNAALLREVRQALGCAEVHVTDKRGVIINSAVDPMVGDPRGFVGYHMAAHAQSEPFMKCLTDPKLQICQDPVPRGADHKLFQYAGSALLDGSGIVQIGEEGQNFKETLLSTAIARLSHSLRIGLSGQILICDNRNKILGAARADYEGRTLESLGFSEQNINDIRAGEGELEETIEGIKINGYHAKIQFYDDDWSNEAIKTNHYNLIGFIPYDEMNHDRNSMLLMLVLSGLVILLVVYIAVSFIVKKVVIDDILSINRQLKKITEGNLETRVNERNNPEFCQLSDGINAMVDALQAAIAAEKSRLDRELEFARSVQAAALPQMVSDPRFDLFAYMDTAKEVGGDFYDFFRIGDDYFAFLIADVSGKGIPAALFMMTAKAQIKSGILNNPNTPLNEIIKEVNDAVCEGNDACMFVTVFVAILNLKTGELIYVNAGHNAPIIRRENGECDWLPVESGFVIGGIDGVDFKRQTIQFNPGDSILLYTDGVTEAMNPQNQLYGDERLINLMNGPVMRFAPPECVLDEIRSDVALYVDGAPQSDDITMVYLSFRGTK